MNKTRILLITSAILLLITAGGLIYAGMYFYNMHDKYGSIYAYYDVEKNPYKYSFNYKIASMLAEQEEKFKDAHSTASYMSKMDKKHRGQINKKSKTIVKYIDMFYDTQRALISGDYKNVQPIKIDKQDYKVIDKELLERIFDINIFFCPELESKEKLRELLAEKENLRKLLEEKYKVIIPHENMVIPSLSYRDRFFIDLEEEGKTNIISTKVKELYNDNSYTNKIKKQLEALDKIYPSRLDAALDGAASKIISQIYYAAFYQLFGNQYTAKDMNGEIYKIKPTRGGTRQYWEMVKVDLDEEARLDRMKELERNYQESIRRTERMLKNAQIRLNNALMY